VLGKCREALEGPVKKNVLLGGKKAHALGGGGIGVVRRGGALRKTRTRRQEEFVEEMRYRGS